MVTKDTPWRHLGAVPLATWQNLIRQAGGSPDFADPRVHAAYGDDSALALAQSEAESSYASNYRKIKESFRDPLNLQIDGAGVDFSKGGSVSPVDAYVAGAKEWKRRLYSADYKNGVYTKAKSIYEMVSQFAPESDGNDPLGYSKEVAAHINKYGTTEVETPSTPEEPIVAVKITQQMIPKGNRNRPGDKLNVAPLWITIHDTGNPGAGADAQMHATFVKNGGGESSVSFHGTVDDAEAIQLLPADEIGWHAGDGCDNRTTDLGCFQSFAIETCVNSDGNWTKTKANLVDFVAAIITGDPRIDYAGRKGQFSVDRIAQHNKWSGKHCPAKIRNEGSWNTIIAAIKAKVAEIEGGTTPAEPVYVDPEPMAPGTYVKNDRLFLEVNKDYTTTKATKPYKYADFKPTQQTGPEIPKGTKIKALHVVSDTGATSDLTLVIDALKVGDYQIKPGSRIDGKAVAS